MKIAVDYSASQPISSFRLSIESKPNNKILKIKFNTLTFGYFFPKLLKILRYLNFSLSKVSSHP